MILSENGITPNATVAAIGVELPLLTFSDMEKRLPAQGTYDRLPKVLKSCIHAISNEDDKPVFLYGGLSLLSSVFNIYGFYNEKKLYCNLFTYLIAKSGTGKGVIDMAFKMIAPIADFISVTSTDDTGYATKTLLFPGNISSAALISELELNNGKGLIYETEGDTLASAIKKEFGDFSDILRKFYHHEPISYKRKGERKRVYIPNPRASVCITSTFGQLLSLIPTGENGLFSRFMYFEMANPSPKFHARLRAGTYLEKIAPFLKAGETIFEIFQKCKDSEFCFEPTEKQEEQFNQIFQGWKDQTTALLDGQDDFFGSIHRGGVIAFRIAMILTLLRYAEDGRLEKRGDSDEKLICSDDDFCTAIELSHIAINNAFSIFKRLPASDAIPILLGKNAPKKERQHFENQRIKDLFEGGASLTQIAKLVFGGEQFKERVRYRLSILFPKSNNNE
jgi:Protein of unknown function (DUF3987)